MSRREILFDLTPVRRDRRRRKKTRPKSQDSEVEIFEEVDLDVENNRLTNLSKAQNDELQRLQVSLARLRSQRQDLIATQQHETYELRCSCSSQPSELKQEVESSDPPLPDELCDGSGLDVDEWPEYIQLKRGPLLPQLPTNHWFKLHWDLNKVRLFRTMYLMGVSATRCPAVGPHVVGLSGFATRPQFPSIKLGAYVRDDITDNQRDRIKWATNEYMRKYWGPFLELEFLSAEKFFIDDNEISTEFFYRLPRVFEGG